MKGLISGRESILEGEDDAFFLADNSGEPTKFHQANNHHEADERVKCQMVICKEFEDMKNKGVWEVISKEKIPEGRRCLKRKYSILRNGIFRAILVAC
jgi:hypothetical protein